MPNNESEGSSAMPALKSLLVATILAAFANHAWAQHSHAAPAAVAQAQPAPKAAPPAQAQPRPAAPQGPAAMGDMHAPHSFTLRSGIAEGRMVYLGDGGDIDGKVNP